MPSRPRLTVSAAACPVCGVPLVRTAVSERGRRYALDDDCPNCGYFYSAAEGETHEHVGLVCLFRRWRLDDRREPMRPVNAAARRETALAEARAMWADPDYQRLHLTEYERDLYSEADMATYGERLLGWLAANRARYPLAFRAARRMVRRSGGNSG